MNATLAGTGTLVRLILRRDRLRLSLWIVGLVTLMAVSAAQVHDLYADPTRLAAYVRTMDGNPALVIFGGPGYGFDRPTVGAVLVNETSLWMALACALMSVFAVVRHTRAEEDAERADLIRSAVVGRHAPIVAALAVALAADVVVAVASTVATIAAGFGVTGSIALCASLGLTGAAFAAVAAVAAQLAGGSRGALGLGAGTAALAFVVRGLGDVAAPAVSWATPFGWGIGVRAFAGERWWTLAGFVGLTAAATGGALWLSTHRDLGAGLRAPRPGRRHAPRWMTSPLGLAFRLQRATIVAWAIGLLVTGVVYGSVGDDVEGMVRDNPEIADYLARLGGASVADSYLATALRLLGLLASGFAIASALRCRSEEAAGHAEQVLAGSVSRWRWAGAQLAITLAGTVVVVAAAGLGLGIGYAGAVGDASQVPRLASAGLATLPAVLVFVGVAVALFGWVPHGALTAWGALAVAAVVGVFATVLRLPHWLVLVSPFEHVPSLPAAALRPLPLVLLALVAAALVAGGLAGFRRRGLVAS